MKSHEVSKESQSHLDNSILSSAKFLIEESEKNDLKAAKNLAEKLSEEVLPEFSVRLLHGKMKPAEKNDIMKDFAEGKINGEQTIKTKSIPQILRENILTFFNFVFVAFAVILLFFTFIEFKNVDGKTVVETNFTIAGFGNFGFMILIIGNCVVGVVQGIRSKKPQYNLYRINLLVRYRLRNFWCIDYCQRTCCLQLDFEN